MPTYERVGDDGQVVERVTPIPGDHEDTRLGCAVIDGKGGWRVAVDPATAATPPESPSAASEEPSTPEPDKDSAEEKPAGRKPARNSKE